MNKRVGAARILDDSKLAEVFGIEMAEPLPEPRSRGKSAAPKGKQLTAGKKKATRRRVPR